MELPLVPKSTKVVQPTLGVGRNRRADRPLAISPPRREASVFQIWSRSRWIS